MLIRLENLAREIAGEFLFANVTVQLNPGEKVGLIGGNGCGKTTLFDLIEGTRLPERGVVRRASGLVISRVPQVPAFNLEASVLSQALRVFDDLRQLEIRLRELEKSMASLAGTVPDDLGAEYEALRMRFRLQGGYDYEARCQAVLFGIGLGSELIRQPCRLLSGGQRNRLLLAQALLRPCDLLLLDEPTNHLDIEGILWLTQYLRSLRRAFMVISHDRDFLDQVTERIWEFEGGRLFDYAAPYSRSRRLRRDRIEVLAKERRRQLEWKARTEDFIRRNIAGQKTRQAQSRQKALQRVQWIEEPKGDPARPHIQIRDSKRGGALNFEIRDGMVGFSERVLIRDVSFRLQRGDRVGILGPNGSGKTTLLRALIGEIPLLKGEIEWGQNVDCLYFSQHNDVGPEAQSVYEALREFDSRSSDSELRSFAALFLFRGEEIWKPVSALSGGERSRLSLARLLLRPANLLIMDEPTNHLDIAGREAVEEALNAFDGSLLLVSHDRYFLRQVASRFYWIQDDRLVPVDDPDSQPGLQTEKSQEVPSAAPRRVSQVTGLSKNERERRLRRFLELEARIEALEARKSQLAEALQKPELDYASRHRLADQHQELQNKLDPLYREWEDLGESLVGDSVVREG